MGKRGRPPVLDDFKKREILAILSVGCSRRVAAEYVDCTPATIRNTADRDPRFAERLRRAEYNSEIGYLRSIQNAAKQERYWRAAAWALERKNPQDFAPRHPDVVTIDQIAKLLAKFSEIVVEEVPIAEFRKNALKRLDGLAGTFGRSKRREANKNRP